MAVFLAVAAGLALSNPGQPLAESGYSWQAMPDPAGVAQETLASAGPPFAAFASSPSPSYDGAAYHVVLGTVNGGQGGAGGSTHATTDSGNGMRPLQANMTRTDTEKPLIVVIGDRTISVEVGSAYADQGATCTDETDGALDVTATGTVDTTTVGTYTITYTCTDSSQNEATQITRTVTVTGIDPSHFVTTWQTTTPGESITIPVDGASGTYTVDWGDGSVSVDVTGDQTHVYDDPGAYTVSISGDFTRIYLHTDAHNAANLLSIDQWGDMRWESMNSAFSGASNMRYNATDVPDLSAVTDMSHMFMFVSSFNGDLSSWDVSSVTHMFLMFLNASSFTGDPFAWWDLDGVDTFLMLSGSPVGS